VIIIILVHNEHKNIYPDLLAYNKSTIQETIMF